MSDNTTAHTAESYEAEVGHTIPFHAELIRQAIDVAFTTVPSVARWLDTGCGPGRLAATVHERAPRVELWLADPSGAMLALARAHNPDLPPERFLPSASEELPDGPPFDVVTAVQCHHYGDAAARERALRRCHSRLVTGGVLVTFENVRAETDEGHALQRARWASWLRSQGRDDAAVAGHLGREGTHFFPIRVSEHVALLEHVGFRSVEVIWRAYGQAGLVGRV